MRGLRSGTGLRGTQCLADTTASRLSAPESTPMSGLVSAIRHRGSRQGGSIRYATHAHVDGCQFEVDGRLLGVLVILLANLDLAQSHRAEVRNHQHVSVRDYAGNW